MERREIHGKPIYIFESHNVAFAAWAEIKASYDGELLLLTLDHHTDVHEAFVGWAYKANGDLMDDNVSPLIEGRLAKVDWRNEQSVQDAVAELKNDEQIDAALRLGLFSYAFCFNNQHTNTRSIEEERFSENWTFGAVPPEPPFTYRVPRRRIFEIGEICEIGCEKVPHDDDCMKPAADQGIESVMLERLIGKANAMARAAGLEDITQVPYVLDIDLDYFRTKDALRPKDATVFHHLIRNAVAITIATEPDYVRTERLERDLTSDYSLERILEHIGSALSE